MTGRTHDITHRFSGAVVDQRNGQEPAPEQDFSAEDSAADDHQYRPRVRFADAAIVHQRVIERADELGLRCGARTVLQAVLTLLCVEFSRVRDDQVRLWQILARFPAGSRRLSLRTIGRLLGQLAALELIVYRPARGCGAHAEIAIHPAFLHGVVEPSRDRSGRLILPEVEGGSGGNVPFAPLIGPKVYPPTPRSNGTVEEPRNTRPVEVAVDPNEVRWVLTQMPSCYRQLPSNLRWTLGRLIRDRLARGFRPEQVLAILAAPLPAGVNRPLALAKRRFALNMPGVGPRLAPLQKAWDAAETDQRRLVEANRLDEQFTQVKAAVGAVMVSRLAAAECVAESRLDPVTHRKRAVVSAARQARRAHPHLPLTEATERWLTERTPKPAEVANGPIPQALTVADLLAALPAGRCTACGGIDAELRTELPVPVPVCQDCWDHETTDTDLRSAVSGMTGRPHTVVVA